MPVLQLGVRAINVGRHVASIRLEADVIREAESNFAFEFSYHDQESLRWYLEDFRLYPEDPAPTIAARVEDRLATLGTELFARVFSNHDAADLWKNVRSSLASTRFEIRASDIDSAALPWELLRDPGVTTPLAMAAHSFVRSSARGASHPRVNPEEKGKVRILLVICRPQGAAGGQDVPFRSVASKLLRELGDSGGENYELTVLRPATFGSLRIALAKAFRAGNAYNVVHFDGHGDYLDFRLDFIRRVYMNFLASTPPLVGRRGYLWFETEVAHGRGELVDGKILGDTLAEFGVAVLAVNACRSAYADPSPLPRVDKAGDAGLQALAMGSLGEEVAQAGVPGVVAMRYNVHVATAAQFVAGLYRGLANGKTVGEAVTHGRRALAERSTHEVVGLAMPFQDWVVPVVYEDTPVRLSLGSGARPGGAALSAGPSRPPVAHIWDPDAHLPSPPEAGFHGRDDVLLAIDRAFDHTNTVLIHGSAGSGKTVVALEFARWYAATGGIHGPRLFSSFERYLPVSRLLSHAADALQVEIDRHGVNWLTLGAADRRRVIIELMNETPVFWIWDSVEAVAGYPQGADSEWAAEDQRELGSLLRALDETKAKVLLTSRREERAWLGSSPMRIEIQPMAPAESLELVRGLVGAHGWSGCTPECWRPLIEFADGNPLALTLATREAIQRGVRSEIQIGEFVDLLRDGEGAFIDHSSEGLTRPLRASLAHRFADAFSEGDRKILSLLHLFQGSIDVSILRTMGDQDRDWSLVELRQETFPSVMKLLERAVEVGLLQVRAGASYAVHPAVRWFLREQFERLYETKKEKAVEAYVRAVGELASDYHVALSEGNRSVLESVRGQEANLLSVLRWAKGGADPVLLAASLEPLRILYEYDGRSSDWRRVVEDIEPEVFDASGFGPRSGREKQWHQVAQYVVKLAIEDRRWKDAERLQSTLVEWARERARPVKDALGRDAIDPNIIAKLSYSLVHLGEIRRGLGRADCIDAYREALELDLRLGKLKGAAVIAYKMGQAFQQVPCLRNLGQAEVWHRSALEWTPAHDRLGRAKCLYELGIVAFERFLEKDDLFGQRAETRRLLAEVERLNFEALDLLPPDALLEEALCRTQLGALYSHGAGNGELAAEQYRGALAAFDRIGDVYRASMCRYNLAYILTAMGRNMDALDYCEAAIVGFEKVGNSAAEWVQNARRLVDFISTR